MNTDYYSTHVLLYSFFTMFGFGTTIFYLILSILVGAYAKKRKGRSFIFYFLISVILTPIISLLIALIVDDLREEEKNHSDDDRFNFRNDNKRRVYFRFNVGIYYITIENFTDKDYDKAKEMLISQYKPLGYNLVIHDSYEYWQIKQLPHSKSYIQIARNNTNYLKITIANVEEKPIIFENKEFERGEDIKVEDNKEENNEDNSTNDIDNSSNATKKTKAEQLIELSKMLEKGHLTEDEFKKMKKKLMEED